jgi:hypothetical protein
MSAGRLSGIPEVVTGGGTVSSGSAEQAINKKVLASTPITCAPVCFDPSI